MLFQLKASQRALWLWALLCSGAGLCIYYSGLGLLWQVLAYLFLFLYSAKLYWSDFSLNSATAIVALRYCDDNSWQLYERNGKLSAARLKAGSVSTATFSLLCFALEGKGERRVMIFSDMLGAEHYQRLQFFLRQAKV